MSKAATRRIEASRVKPVTAAELADVAQVDETALTAILDGFVDDGILDVAEVDGEIRYFPLRERGTYAVIAALHNLVEDREIRVAFPAPAIAALSGLAAEAQEAGAPADEHGYVEVDVSKMDGEELRPMLRELRRIRRQFAWNPWYASPRNDHIRERLDHNIRSVREMIRRSEEARRASPPQTLCVSCGKRARHFGDFCKRCAPEEERPHGKVA